MIKPVVKYLLVLTLAWSVSAKLNDPRQTGFWKAMAAGRKLQVDNGIPDDIENGVTEGNPLEGGDTEHGLNLEQCEGDVSCHGP